MSAGQQPISTRQKRMERAAGLLKLQGVVILCLTAAFVAAMLLVEFVVFLLIPAGVLAAVAACYLLLALAIHRGRRWAVIPALVVVSMHWAAMLFPIVAIIASGLGIHNMAGLLTTLGWFVLLSWLLVRLAQCLAGPPEHGGGFEPVFLAMRPADAEPVAPELQHPVEGQKAP